MNGSHRVSLHGASKHGEGCTCQRCTGFLPANRAAEGKANALSHGCYSLLRLQPRAQALREEIAPLVPFGSEADGPLLDVLAMTLAQVERAGLVLAIEQQESGDGRPSKRVDRLSQDARSWANTAAKILDQLAMSPAARGRLAGDLAGAQRSLTAQALREKYGATGEAA